MTDKASEKSLVRLKAWRLDHGLTQVQLAKRLRCAQSAISRIEAGRRVPRPGLAYRIKKMMEAKCLKRQ